MTNRKVFKIIWITIAGIIAFYVLALIVISILANKEKARILATINNALKENLQGEAHIKNIELNAWRHFPSIEIRLEDVSLIDTLYHLPVLSAGSISTTVSLIQVVKSNKSISNLEVKDAVFHLFTDSAGYSNNYLLKLKKKPAPETTGKKKNQSIFIRQINIENTLVLIENKQKEKRIEFTATEVEAKLDKKDSVIHINLKEDCLMKTGLGFNLSKGSYLENQQLEGEWQLDLNTSSKTISFNKTKLAINKHDYELTGYFDFSEKQQFKIQVDTKDVKYSDASALVTNAIRKKLVLFDLQKPINVTGIIEGSLLAGGIPYVNVLWNTKDNVLQTPAATFSNCGFEGNFLNEVIKDSPRTDPNSRIIFTTFSGDWDGIQLSGKNIMVNNLENSTLKFNLTSNCTFDALDRKFALSTIRFVKGAAALELQYDGPLTNGKEIVENLHGSLHIQDGEVQYIPRDFTFTNCSGDIYFLEDSISLKKIQCDYKDNHFEVNVDGKNIRKRLLNTDTANATMICNVFSPSVNLGDFKTLFSPTSEKKVVRKQDKVKFSKTASGIDDMLEKGALQINLKANTLKYNRLLASNVNAGILFRQHNWQITGFSVNLADGSLNAKGNIRQINPKYHEASLVMQMKNMNVQKAFYAFDDFGQNGISSKHIRGILNADANVKLGINSSGNIIPSTTKGIVNFSLKNGALINYEPLMKLQNFVLANKDVSNVKFAELKDKLEVDGDKLYISRMEIQSTALSMFIEGVYGFKGNTDLLLQLPLSNLSARDKNYIPKNIGVNSKVGPSVRVRASSGDDGKVKFNLTFSKKVKNKENANK